jgi:hypothetical protein
MRKRRASPFRKHIRNKRSLFQAFYVPRRRLLFIIRDIVGDNGPVVNAFSLTVERSWESDP